MELTTHRIEPIHVGHPHKELRNGESGISTNTTDFNESMRSVKKLLDKCTNDHSLCENGDRPLPKRLLELNPNRDCVRLVELGKRKREICCFEPLLGCA